jgi:hypothetical protein
MKVDRWIQSLLLGLMVLGAGTVTARADGYADPGAYVGGGFTYSAHLFEDNLNDVIDEVDISLDQSAGFNLYGGYRLLSFLALEGEYEYVDGFQGTVEGVDVLTIQGHTFTGNLRLIAPIYRVQPFFVIGIGSTKYSLDESVTGLNLGIDDTALAIRVKGGVEGYFTKNFGVSAAFGGVITTHDIDNITATESLSGMHYLALQLGAVIRF